MSNPSTARAVEFSDLGFRYTADSVWTLRHYTGSIPPGSILAVLGRNGSGKSTLLKLLLGVLQPLEGRIQRSGGTAFIPQQFDLSFPFDVLEVVLMGRVRRVGIFSTPSRQDRDAARDALERVGIGHLAHRSFDQLSGGERQLVLFARALVSEAAVWILDEPASALDLRHQESMLEQLTRLAHEAALTVIFSTHAPQHALAIADAALLMFGEAGFALGNTAQVLSEANLQRLYGVEMRKVSFTHNGQPVEEIVPIWRRRAIRTKP